MEIERRRSERTAVNVKAELISDEVSYTGVLENLSEDGIFMTTSPTKSAKGFIPGTIYRLKFQPSQGKMIDLSCEVVWFYTETSALGLIFSLGMKVINASEEYKEFLETL